MIDTNKNSYIYRPSKNINNVIYLKNIFCFFSPAFSGKYFGSITLHYPCTGTTVCIFLIYTSQLHIRPPIFDLSPPSFPLIPNILSPHYSYFLIQVISIRPLELHVLSKPFPYLPNRIL